MALETINSNHTITLSIYEKHSEADKRDLFNNLTKIFKNYYLFYLFSSLV